MDYKTSLGLNRTGIQMSPFDTAAMQAGLAEFGPPADAHREDTRVRLDYADLTEGLGSVPVPGTARGMLKSGIDMLTGKRPQVLVDKLGERLAFERSGVRMYESALVKCVARRGTLVENEVEVLRLHRDQELEHMHMVRRALESLGADPTAQTPCADLAGMQAMGMVQAINDPRTSLVQVLQVILDIELMDNAAWELLIELARAAGHGAMADGFAVALQQEQQHLAYVRALVRRLTLQDASVSADQRDAL